MQGFSIIRLSLLFLFFAGLFGIALFHAPAKAGSDEPPAKTITASGCVTAGVEPGCLLVTDKKTGTVYNVYFRGRKKPQVGSAIRFTGAPHDGPTTCMQGRAVNVRTWFPLKMKCESRTTETGGC